MTREDPIGKAGSMNFYTLNQPFGPTGEHQTLGGVLTEALEADRFASLWACVAYSVTSGTSRLFGPLREFRGKGCEVTIYLGARNGITSRQAVEHLLNTGASVFLCDTKGRSLFHPKVYLMRGAEHGLHTIGSSNLTVGGLYTHYEANSVFELDLRDEVDLEHMEEAEAWFDWVPTSVESCLGARVEDLAEYVEDRLLVDESRLVARLPSRPTRDGARDRGASGRVIIPAAPPPHPEALPVRPRKLRVGRAVKRGTTTKATPPQVPGGKRYFAMTLSEFDSSHRRGTPGTPEMSIPEAATDFFPPTALRGRKYPDAYFDVLLNSSAGSTATVEYRVWQRPPGSATGHADWRINVKHSTIDLTRPGGGDILLIERLSEEADTLYEVWVVQPSDTSYQSLLRRLNRQVSASGRAGTKNYGFF